MKSKLLLVTLLLGFSQFQGLATAATTPRSLATDTRVRHVVYDPNQVFEIVGTYGYQTSLEFAPDEEVKVISLGDTIAWQTVSYKNRIFLKPVEPNARTNMTVITNKRTYYLMLTSTKRSKDTTFLVRFQYPKPAPMVTQTSVQSQKPTDEGFDPDKINLDYSTSGSTSAIPLTRVLDDGQFTYFRFKDGGDIPSIYTVAPDGTESLVNSRREGTYIVVERTAGLFTLRDGTEHLCVKNNQYQASDKKPEQTANQEVN